MKRAVHTASHPPRTPAVAGSSALIEQAVREQLGLPTGGRKFMATVSLATVLAMTFALAIQATIKVDDSNSPYNNGQIGGSGTSGTDVWMDVSSGAV